jgi:hypothetical protein
MRRLVSAAASLEVDEHQRTVVTALPRKRMHRIRQGLGVEKLEKRR